MPQPDCPILLSGCPGVDSPITNTSAEAADTFQWAAQIWSPWDPYRPPPLGDGMYFKQDCTALAGEIFANFDPIVFADTQAMANIIALGQSLGCPWNIPEVSGITLQNDAQSATVTCPDGSSFTYTVEAGLYQIDAAILCGYPTDTVDFVNSGGASQTITHPGCFVQFTSEQILPDGTSTNSATWLCVDGHTFTQTVSGYQSAAAIACKAWVDMANQWAQAEALYQATSLMDCITKDDPPAPGEDPPALTPGPGILTTPTWVCLGEEFFSSYNISGRGSADYTIDVISGTLPPGLTFTQVGPKRATLSGTTTTAGEYTFTIKGTATLAPYSVVQATVTIFVFGLVSDLLPDATQNILYSETLTADGGTAPYTFSLDPDSDPLPTGLTLASSGTVSGTPTVSGDFVLTVMITDANGGECSQDVSLSVAPGIDWSSMVWVTSKSGAVSLVVPTTPGGTQDNCRTYIQAPNTLSAAMALAVGTINYTGSAIPIHFTGTVIRDPSGFTPPNNQDSHLRVLTKIGANPTVVSYILTDSAIVPPGAISLATGPFSVGFTIPDTGGENCVITVECLCNNTSAFGGAYEQDITVTISND